VKEDVNDSISSSLALKDCFGRTPLMVLCMWDGVKCVGGQSKVCMLVLCITIICYNTVIMLLLLYMKVIVVIFKGKYILHLFYCSFAHIPMCSRLLLKIKNPLTNTITYWRKHF
jgi:hypothetical protein